MTQPRTVRNLVHSARTVCAKPSRLGRAGPGLAAERSGAIAVMPAPPPRRQPGRAPWSEAPWNSTASLVSSMYASSRVARWALTSLNGTWLAVRTATTRLRRQAGHRQRVRRGRGDLSPRIGQHRHRLGERRRAEPHAAAGGGGDEVGDRAVGDDLATADDDQVVGGVLQLAHQVAGHEDGAALAGEVAQEAAHPGDALGVHAVERLVHHQYRGVAEQRGGDAEALPHAE